MTVEVQLFLAVMAFFLPLVILTNLALFPIHPPDAERLCTHSPEGPDGVQQLMKKCSQGSLKTFS
jgi:hypothetical protein